MSKIQDSKFKIQNLHGPLALSVAVHLAALMWMGASHLPVGAKEAGPMAVYLAAAGGTGSRETEVKEIEPSAEAREEGAGEQGEERNSLRRAQGAAGEQGRVGEGTLPNVNQSALIVEEQEREAEDKAAAAADPGMIEETSRSEKLSSPEVHSPEGEGLSSDAGGREHATGERSGIVTSGLPPRNVLASLGGGAVGSAGAHQEAMAEFPLPPVDREALDLPVPRYPAASRRRGEQGTVILSVTVGGDGRVAGARLYRSSGFPMLDRAALSAADEARRENSAAMPPGWSERLVAYTFRLVE